MQNLLKVVRALEGWFLGALMILISFAYGGNVLIREVFPSLGPKLAWIEEACLIGLVWMVFFGLALGLEQGRQIAMGSALARMGPTLMKRVKLVINVTGLIFSLYLTNIGYDITVFVANSGQTSPTLDISMAWMYVVMPIGFGLLAIRYALELFTDADRYIVELDPTQHI